MQLQNVQTPTPTPGPVLALLLDHQPPALAPSDIDPTDPAAALVGECDCCGAPEGLLVTHGGIGGEYRCKHCAQVAAAQDAAMTHLENLLRPVMWAWSRHWSDTPDLFQSLEVEFGEIGRKLADEINNPDATPPGLTGEDVERWRNMQRRRAELETERAKINAELETIRRLQDELKHQK